MITWLFVLKSSRLGTTIASLTSASSSKYPILAKLPVACSLLWHVAPPSCPYLISWLGYSRVVYSRGTITTSEVCMYVSAACCHYWCLISVHDFHWFYSCTIFAVATNSTKQRPVHSLFGLHVVVLRTCWWPIWLHSRRLAKHCLNALFCLFCFVPCTDLMPAHDIGLFNWLGAPWLDTCF